MPRLSFSIRFLIRSRSLSASAGIVSEASTTNCQMKTEITRQRHHATLSTFLETSAVRIDSRKRLRTNREPQAKRSRSDQEIAAGRAGRKGQWKPSSDRAGKHRLPKEITRQWLRPRCPEAG